MFSQSILDDLQFPALTINVTALIRQHYIFGLSNTTMIDRGNKVRCVFQPFHYAAQLMGASESPITFLFSDCQNVHQPHCRQYVLMGQRSGVVYPAPPEISAFTPIADRLNEQLAASQYRCYSVTITTGSTLNEGHLKRQATSFSFAFEPGTGKVARRKRTSSYENQLDSSHHR
jgi:hypothetical protein